MIESEIETKTKAVTASWTFSGGTVKNGSEWDWAEMETDLARGKAAIKPLETRTHLNEFFWRVYDYNKCKLSQWRTTDTRASFVTG